MQNWKVVLTLAVGTFLASTGVRADDTANPDWKALDVGMIASGGITISSMMPGQTFSYRTGEAFTPDFAIDCTNFTPSAAEYVPAIKAGAKVVKIEVTSQAQAPGPQVAQKPARGKVRGPLVTPPRVYYGVLALCKIHKSAVGPASRAYNVQVPQEYLDKAQDGFVSVVGEKVAVARFSWETPTRAHLSLGDLFRLQPQTQQQQSGQVQEDFSWVLWLTDRAPTFTEQIPAGVVSPQH